MLDDGGNLSIDFLAGMTIFMVALIWVANIVPGLLIGLQSRSIDLDAIAYRTGVILVEDPGMQGNPELPPSSWDTLTYIEIPFIERFGLSAAKDSPNILNLNKVERFFCSTLFSYPEDYQSRVIFGDRPYRFNISLKTFDALITKSVGDIKPDGYGYIRRLVKIKYPSNTTIDAGLKKYGNSDNVTYHSFFIDLNLTELIVGQPNLAYQINPRQDRILVNITNLSGARVWHKDPLLDNITMENIVFYRKDSQTTSYGSPVTDYKDCIETLDKCKFFAYIDGASAYNPNVPVIVNDNISVMFSPGYFYKIADDDNRILRINYIFSLSHAPDGDNFFNNSFTSPYFYNYSPSQVTQPTLKEGALEVAIW
jgi:hypothetical protein